MPAKVVLPDLGVPAVRDRVVQASVTKPYWTASGALRKSDGDPSNFHAGWDNAHQVGSGGQDGSKHRDDGPEDQHRYLV